MSLTLLFAIAIASDPPASRDTSEVAADLEADLDESLAVQAEICAALGIVCEPAPAPAPPAPAPALTDAGTAVDGDTNEPSDTELPATPVPLAIVPELIAVEPRKLQAAAAP